MRIKVNKKSLKNIFSLVSIIEERAGANFRGWLTLAKLSIMLPYCSV